MAEPFADLVIGKTHGTKVIHGALSQEVEAGAHHFGRVQRGGPLGLARGDREHQGMAHRRTSGDHSSVGVFGPINLRLSLRPGPCCALA